MTSREGEGVAGAIFPTGVGDGLGSPCGLAGERSGDWLGFALRLSSVAPWEGGRWEG